MANPREYGLGNDYTVLGAPRLKGPADLQHPCPHCGCATLYTIEVDVQHRLLRGGRGVGSYLGCPACPWASPMVTRATTAPHTPQAAQAAPTPAPAGRRGLAVRIEIPGACNLSQILADARGVIGDDFKGRSYTLSVFCLGCAAIQRESPPAGEEQEPHAADCPAACSLCDTAPPDPAGG